MYVLIVLATINLLHDLENASETLSVFAFEGYANQSKPLF